jgi:hypothetical protein
VGTFTWSPLEAGSAASQQAATAPFVQIPTMPPPRAVAVNMGIAAALARNLQPVPGPAAPTGVPLHGWRMPFPPRDIDRQVHRRPTWFGRLQPSTAIPGVGPAGAATFVLDLEIGSQLTFSWRTEVQKALNGIEQRISDADSPAIAYDVTAFLFDEEERTVRSALIVGAATSQPFLLALPFEGLEVSTGSVGAIVNVWSSTLCDWANPGQRVCVKAPDGTTALGVVQSATPSSITLDVAPGSAGVAGGRIMPTVAIYLEPEQGFTRHPIATSHWHIKALSALFGYANVATMGVGAAVTTYDGMPVYDRGIRLGGQTQQALLTLGTVVDAGGLRTVLGGASVVDELRPVRLEISTSDVALWQWFKLFLFTVKGMFAPFLRPTWQPDLVFDSNPGGATAQDQERSVAGCGQLPDVLQREPRAQTSADPQDRRLRPVRHGRRRRRQR